ncbi:type II toxin-antitoxin system HipA family toxin [Terriglobus tenax]|uniref:type II toxin-antitoxin system HipA family toxin n=1 Tax=Terriglobus tenax TaxID=1111115 RepID=UPI0021E05161|nr:HipA domain-containing protein [Terriglobus tenax]
MAGLDSIEVHVDLETAPEPELMGMLHRQRSGKGELFSFEYAKSWMARAEAFAFDPDLQLGSGHQYPSGDRTNFGIFTDSSPDRWGRLLMQRRENARARREGARPRTLTEWDFLLGVHDETRLGALRFRFPEGPFVDSDERFAAPPLTSLRELQAVSLQFEEHINEQDHPEYEKWLGQLIAPGSSLGGARPKASVRDEEGTLCIAKFPSRQDLRDIGAWELVANSLAREAGIQVPDARPLHFPESPYTTFLVKRFDRTHHGRRRGFVSAMTLTQHKDGEDGASYLELVELLQQRGAQTLADCEQLFRRVLFNIRIHNTDDHLRNHGFFIDARGIALSPAYDLNPSVERDYLSLSIDETEATCDVAIAMEAFKSYGITAAQAKAALHDVEAAVSNWRLEAKALGISKDELDLMAAAFDES